MNAQEFISSGILEAYLIGVATESERTEVETMAARHPEVKAELMAIEKTLNKYATSYSVEPPVHLQDKILSTIASTPRASSSNETQSKEFRIEPMETEKTSSKFSVLSIAASVALLISIPLNLYLYSKVSSDESKMTAMNNQQLSLMSAIKDSSAAYQSMRNEAYVLRDPMFKMVRLNGLKASPDAKAMACWCPDSKELYFEPEKLPAAPKGMQYQLWAIVDGKPVDAGMIKMDSGMQKMKLISNATAFAVTLEKEGGSDSPHGDMYVMGSI